jgi:mTERF domain-containing protein
VNHYINDEDDPFIDEVDQLFQYMNALQDEDNDENTSMLNGKEKDVEEETLFELDLSGLDDFTNAKSFSYKTNVTLDEFANHAKEDEEEEEAVEIIVPDLNTLLSNVQLAPASEIAYFYLQNTIGLSTETMWKITNDAGSVLGFTVANLETKISLLKRLLNLTDEDVRDILTKQPTILHMSADRNLSPTILFLVRALDLSKKDLRKMVVSYPAILCYSIPNLKNKLSFFQKELQLDMTQTRNLLVLEPRLFCAAVKTGIMPRFKFLHREMKIPISDLKDIVLRNPKILLYSLKDNLQPKMISFFVMRLQMEPSHIIKLLKSFPFIMDYNLEDHMLPIARYFLTELEFSPMELRKILLKFPRLMTHSMFKIKHVVGYFRFQLRLDAADVKRMLFQAPQIISLSTDDTLVSKVKFLRDTFGLDGDDELRKVITGQPTLLLCSMEKNILPKANYLLDKFGHDSSELKQAILTLPTLLAYSLDSRIKPRMESILDLNIEPAKITIGIVMTESNFEKWLIRQSEKKLLHIGTTYGTNFDYTEDGDIASGDIPEDILEQQQKEGRIRHWKR